MSEGLGVCVVEKNSGHRLMLATDQGQSPFVPVLGLGVGKHPGATPGQQTGCPVAWVCFSPEQRCWAGARDELLIPSPGPVSHSVSEELLLSILELKEGSD